MGYYDSTVMAESAGGGRYYPPYSYESYGNLENQGSGTSYEVGHWGCESVQGKTRPVMAAPHANVNIPSTHGKNIPTLQEGNEQYALRNDKGNKSKGKGEHQSISKKEKWSVVQQKGVESSEGQKGVKGAGKQPFFSESGKIKNG